MKDEYDFSNAKKNPYAKKLKARTTIRLDESSLNYFKGLATKEGIPYQTLINSFLKYCADEKLKPDFKWKKEA